MTNYIPDVKLLKGLFFIMLYCNCFSQVGVRNAFDNRDIYNINFNIGSNESSSEDLLIKSNPYLTPLINGFRYNAYQDKIVDAQDNIANITEIKLGENLFIKKEFFPIWKKTSTTGYLIDIGDKNYLRVQKVIRSNYNPRMNKKTNRKFEQKITYYKLSEGKIKQVKKNEYNKTHLFLELGYTQSSLKDFSNEEFNNRNSIYYGLGRIFHFKNSLDFISHFFYSKNGGFRYYTEEEENGKKIIVFNTIGLEFLLKKQFNRIAFFGGIRTNYALKREQRKASRKSYGFRFRDEYISLEDNLKKIVPLGATIGFSFKLLESIEFEVKYNRGISVLNQNTSKSPRLNSFQAGINYRL